MFRREREEKLDVLLEDGGRTGLYAKDAERDD